MDLDELSAVGIYLNLKVEHQRRIRFAAGFLRLSGSITTEASLQEHDIRIVIGKERAPVARRVSHGLNGMSSSGNTRLACFETFDVEMPLAVGVHKVALELEVEEGHWREVQKSLVLSTPASARGAKNEDVLLEVRSNERAFAAQEMEVRRHVELMHTPPTFVIFVDLSAGTEGFQETIASIDAQFCQDQIVIRLVVPEEQRKQALSFGHVIVNEQQIAVVEGDFFVHLQCGQCLTTNAIYEFTCAVIRTPDLDIVYGDECTVDPETNEIANFQKPDWSPDYLETFNYLGFALCYRSSLLSNGRSTFELFAVMLECTELASEIVHLRKTLGFDLRSIQAIQNAQHADHDSNVKALQSRLARTGRVGNVRTNAPYMGSYDVHVVPKKCPLVSIVIPTAGQTICLNGRSIDLILNIVRQIKQKTTYNNIEIIVVENDDLTIDQKKFLSAENCTMSVYRKAGFNISEKLNQGVGLASGDFLILMNDDIEIFSNNWIERMLEQFEKPHVGVVGPKLLYPDGAVQHAGIAHIDGIPEHVRRLRPGREVGPFFSTCGVQNVDAVTGACMMTPTELYRNLGGYDEVFPLTHNDVDYCMKVRERGLYVVYTPFTEMIHMESVSRIPFSRLADRKLYDDRWAESIL